MNYAVVTYLCNDKFLHGALALVSSIRRNSPKLLLTYKTVCICLEDVSAHSERLLVKAGYEVFRYASTEYLYSNRTDFTDRYRNKSWMMFTKLRIFCLVEFDKIIYLDADVIVRGDVLPLLEYHPPLCAYSDQDAPLDRGGLSAGVLVLQPCLNAFARICSSLDKPFPGGTTDQSLLNGLFPNFIHLPQKYNTLDKVVAPGVLRPIKYGLYRSSVIYHFNGPKPWLPFVFDAYGWNKLPSLAFVEYWGYLLGSRGLGILDKIYLLYVFVLTFFMSFLGASLYLATLLSSKIFSFFRDSAD